MKKEILKRMVALSVALSVIPCGMASAAIEEGSATGANSNAIGAASQATKENATAIGTGAQATASETNAIGRLAKATAIGANAIGQRAEATSTGAIAVGSSTIASGGSAVAIGDTAHATGFGATSVGAGADATGNYANAYGYDAVASGTRASAFGSGAQATDGWTSAFGDQSKATGYVSTAVGYGSEASGTWSNAIGGMAKASGDNAVALGRNANAQGKNSAAIGNASKATEENAMALGNGAQAGHEGSIALGAGSVTTEAYSVSIGSEEQTRKLQFVTDGAVSADSTDAVNGSQLYEEALAREEADDALAEDIATNAADIATNAADIATNAANIDAEATRAQAAEQVLQDNINNEAATRIAADNQLSNRLDSTNNRLDKVGAGAAALAALHPLDYDSENKLSFAAGVGNYAGATAGAIGAFYRPNEDVMFSIGGTAGNGENMVNLGLSFAIGQGSSGVAKLSKAELVTKVQNMEAKCISVDAENKELRHEINNAKAENQKLQDRIAKLEEMVMKLAAK